MIIRKLTKKDIGALVALDKTYVKEKISYGFIPRTKKQFLSDWNNGKNAICFVAEENKEIVGYIFGEKMIGTSKYYYVKKGEEWIDLDTLYVLKKYRSKKLGSKLLIALTGEAKKRGYKCFSLCADSIYFDKLLKFYKLRGYKPLTCRMVKRL